MFHITLIDTVGTEEACFTLHSLIPLVQKKHVLHYTLLSLGSTRLNFLKHYLRLFTIKFCCNFMYLHMACLKPLKMSDMVVMTGGLYKSNVALERSVENLQHINIKVPNYGMIMTKTLNMLQQQIILRSVLYIGHVPNTTVRFVTCVFKYTLHDHYHADYHYDHSHFSISYHFAFIDVLMNHSTYALTFFLLYTPTQTLDKILFLFLFYTDTFSPFLDKKYILVPVAF